MGNTVTPVTAEQVSAIRSQTSTPIPLNTMYAGHCAVCRGPVEPFFDHPSHGRQANKLNACGHVCHERCLGEYIASFMREQIHRIGCPVCYANIHKFTKEDKKDQESKPFEARPPTQYTPTPAAPRPSAPAPAAAPVVQGVQVVTGVPVTVVNETT